MSSSQILIAGAGIGGLTAALALQRQGFRVRVFERAPAVGDIGAGIALGGTASRSLYALGLEQALKAVSDTPQASAAFDYRTGEVLGGAFEKRKWTAKDLVDVNMVHRADLFAVVKAAVDANDPQAVQLDSAVTGYAQDADSATLLLADGRRVACQAVLGCDGIRSTIRTQMFGPGEPRKTGRVAYRFLVPIEQAAPFMSAGTAGIYVGSRVALARYMIRKGSVVNCVAFAHVPEIEGEDWSHRATREELTALFEGWNADVVGLAACAPLDQTARWALYDRDPLDLWTDGRVGLLGDSAHAVLPFLGFGAALGIEDAIVLARAFAAVPNPVDALRVYEAARRRRAGAILLESRRQGEIFDAGPGGTPDPDIDKRESRTPYDARTVVLPDSPHARPDPFYRRSVVSDLISKILAASFTQTIDGQPVATAFEAVIDPSTGRPFHRSPVASIEEIDLAVSTARAAQPGWAALRWDEREACLNRLADAIEAEQEWLATLQTLEQGMPLAESRAGVAYTAFRLRITGKVRVPDELLVGQPGQQVTARWKPRGVVAAIAPWNGPLVLGLWKVGSALISGNSVVLKPSELTPLSTLEIGRIARAILPPGVFNVLGGGRAVGAAMVAHPGFDEVSFTGSTATGVAIATQAAAYLRPTMLELGGNDAAILLADAAVADFVKIAARTTFSNCGQFCAAVKRIYVPTALYDTVCAALVAAAEAYKIGNGLEPGVTIGPIQNKAQFDKVCAIVADAKAAGAKILTGGAPLDRDGYFYPPTVVGGIGDGVRLVDEEQFGPVLPVIAYDDLDAVIATINAGQYGLTGSVWTADLALGAEIADRLVVGTSAVNQHAPLGPTVPFPMIKASGMGIDYADYGVKAGMRLQILNVKLA